MSSEDVSERSQHAASKAFMRRLPLFAGLSEADLERLHQMARTLQLPAGAYAMRQGEPGNELYIVLAGELEVTQRQGEHDHALAMRRVGDVIGEMSVLEQKPRAASVRALQDSQLLVVGRDTLATLLACSSTAALTILQTVAARLRSTESMLMQREKLAALGTLAAGLAHELNNPAAALQRSAKQLREALAAWERAARALGALELDAPQAAAREALGRELEQRASQPVVLEPLARGLAEEAVQDWLAAQGVAAAWELAPALVSAGWDVAALTGLERSFTGEQLPQVAGWLAAASLVHGLLAETGRSAAMISELVRVVKTYSYMDQGPIQGVDVQQGLDNTLVMLRHKLKHGVRVVREYGANLPPVEAYGGELNQVWTNLIDNALEAMGGSGELRLRSYAQGDRVVVEVCDDGPGIPAELQSRIFEPFFTTKPVGAGTGLGLHIAYNIVVHKHQGEIGVQSQPGATCFRVTLPLQLTREANRQA